RLLQENVQQQGWRTYLYDAEQPYTPVASVTGRGESRQVWYYHTDVTGTPQEVTAADGTLVWAGYIRGFGENAADISNSGAYFHQPLRLPGQYFDDETGLHYNLFRYYAPECGRFVSQDPISIRGGLNLYQYAPNSLTWIDPLGLAVDPITKLEDRGYTGVTKTSGGGLDYSNSNALYNKRPGVNPVVTIEYSGDYDIDFQRANAKAGLNQVSTPRGYVWHHLDDYDPVTNKGTMQLIEKQAHRGINHNGGVSQYKTATGIEYTHPARNSGARGCD
ncbi:RHS repeat-associated core domain-containing protein, partial [Salmonella enterica]